MVRPSCAILCCSRKLHARVLVCRRAPSLPVVRRGAALVLDGGLVMDPLTRSSPSPADLIPRRPEELHLAGPSAAGDRRRVAPRAAGDGSVRLGPRETAFADPRSLLPRSGSQRRQRRTEGRGWPTPALRAHNAGKAAPLARQACRPVHPGAASAQVSLKRLSIMYKLVRTSPVEGPGGPAQVVASAAAAAAAAIKLATGSTLAAAALITVNRV